MKTVFRALPWILVLVLGFGAPLMAAGKYKVVPVTNGGTLKGRVRLDGPPPPPERILITKNKKVCGSGERSVQWVPIGPKGGLREMVVYLRKIKQGKKWSGQAAATKAEINQKACEFSPWFQIVRQRAELTVKNLDSVLHNIHIREMIGVKVGRSRAVLRTMFNEGQPPDSGDLKAKIRPRRSNLIRINCEAHNFMFAWMFAADHPYAVKTGKDGTFTIKNIPAGKYDLMSWNPTLGLQKKKVTVKAGKTGTHNFTYKSKS